MTHRRARADRQAAEATVLSETIRDTGDGHLFDAFPNAIIAVDASGHITYANAQAEFTFGYPASDLVGQPIELLVASRATGKHVAHRDAFIRHPVARPMGIGLDLAGRRRDGVEFPVEISLSPIQTPNGLHVFATVVDISARKAAEEAHAESERRFRAVLEASPNAIVAVAEDGAITYANPQAEAAFGYTLNELVGAPLSTLLPERVREAHVGHRHRFNQHPVARPMGIGLDLAGRRKDGAEFPVEISLSPVQTAEGLQVFATVVDITARKAAEAQLLQAQKLESIGRLAGGVAHDFNNILFAIRGYAELLGDDLGGDASTGTEEIRRSVRAIQEAADRGANLTTQLLAFSRQRLVSPVVVDPAEMIHALEPMLRRLIGEHIRLEVRATVKTRIRIDPGQLDQMVMNLVVNARDAMPSGGAVTITVDRAEFQAREALEHWEVSPGSYVVIAVADTGEGMDEETREHAFEPFFTTKERGRGTGLGLATLYGIVRQAGGDVWLTSEPGHGSTFKLFFPSVDDEPNRRTSQPAEIAAPASGTLLLVEDAPAVRDMTRRTLERAGYTVIAVDDGGAALAELADPTRRIDAVVSDVVMPNMSGIELADFVSERWPDMAIVLLSGYTAETLDLDRLLARGIRFVAKPAASQDLLRAVSMALAGRRRSVPET